MKNTLSFLLLIIFLVSCKTQNLEKTTQANESIATATISKIESLGIEGGMVWFEKNKSEAKFNANEDELNRLGYDLLYDREQPQAAVKIFKFNCIKFPDSPNVYDSLAEALLVNNEYDSSVTNYKKAIKLSEGVRFYQLGYLESSAYVKTEIPKDTTSLFVLEGNWENEIAFVYVQGGPDVNLNIHNRDGLHLMPYENQLLKIYPLQSQMINPKSLVCNPIMTNEQAAYENEISAEIVARTIKYLTDQKKKVFLIGHSFGASITMEYLHSKDNLTEKVVIMGLDLDEDISSWDQLKAGEYIRWRDGDKPFVRPIFRSIADNHPSRNSFNNVGENLTMLVRNNMSKEYTKLYSDQDFKNLVSVYSTLDEANGIKSKSELDLLKRKGTVVVKIEGDHHDMLTNEFMGALYEFLILDKPMLESY